MGAPDLRVVDGELPDDMDPPAHLGGYGRECWRRLVAELVEERIVGQVSWDLLEQAAEMYEGRRRSQKTVERYGDLIDGRTGRKKNPAVAKQLEYAREFRQVLKEIGREKDRATPRAEDDDDPYTF